MEQKAFLSTWCRTDMHTKEKDVFLNDLKVSLAPTPQEGSFHVMFVETTHTQEQNKPNVCDWNHLSLSVTVPAKLVFEVQSAVRPDSPPSEGAMVEVRIPVSGEGDIREGAEGGDKESGECVLIDVQE